MDTVLLVTFDTTVVVVMFAEVDPLSNVLRRSQFVNIKLKQTEAGILPLRFGLEVRESVERDEGKEEGAWMKALFWRYLNGNQNWLAYVRDID